MSNTMEPRALQSIAEGIESLAELEYKHPVLGANLRVARIPGEVQLASRKPQGGQTPAADSDFCWRS